MDANEVTKQILSAWDDIQEEEQAAVAEPEEEPDGDGEVPDGADEDEDAGAEEDEGEDEAEAEADEEEVAEEEVEVVAETDPEVAAFLAKYEGDTQKALRAATELQRVIGRQGSEKAALAQRVQELETEMQRAQAFQPGVGYLTAEQNEWVEEAVGSGQPLAYVQRAADDGEFELARAVIEAWGQEQPWEATRAAQQLNQLEQLAQAPEPPPPVNRGVLLDVIAENFPEMRSYEAQMVGVLRQLGDNHPLVYDSRSDDANTAARAIIGIYEIARASSASVRSAKAGLKQKHRQEADSERNGAVVSSASSSPTASETPRRSRQLMPGLTLEDLDAAFAEAQ